MGGQFCTIPANASFVGAGAGNHKQEFCMKNFFKARIAPLFGTQSHWLCAIALAAVIGLSMAACNDGSGDNGGSSGLAGTWGGYIGGYNSTITVTSTGWTMTALVLWIVEPIQRTVTVSLQG
jgi:hypothetical protein